jgi:cyclic dehypoxanthinyl futalosine synthase
MFDRIVAKVVAGERLTPEEGRSLLSEEGDLLSIGQLANIVRFRKHPGRQVTFLIDSNPSYTNVCDTTCHFCAFCRRPGDADAYTLTVDQVMDRVSVAVEQGATTILLQGGHNPDLPLKYYLDLVKETRRRFPGVTPHYFSASEIQTMARVSGFSVEKVLTALHDAGQTTLPGGGAEVLSDRVRKTLAPKKGGPDSWLEVHRAAHRQGFKSTATMMYGHVEGPEDIVDHWDRVRRLQDETGGFTAFIPWSWKPDNSVLSRRHSRGAGPIPYLRMIAASRVYLDNFDHIQASWFSEGKKTGQAALHFGADDFGGTLIEENVHAAAGFVNKAAASEVSELIHGAGFVPIQRTTEYDIIPL